MVRDGMILKYGPPPPREPVSDELKEGLAKIAELRKIEAILDEYREFLDQVGRGILHREDGDQFMEELKVNLSLLRARFYALKEKKKEEKRDWPKIVPMYGVTIPKKNKK